jgi:hypothetical protein
MLLRHPDFFCAEAAAQPPVDARRLGLRRCAGQPTDLPAKAAERLFLIGIVGL